MLISNQSLYLNYFTSILQHISDMVLGVERIVGIYNTDYSTNILSGISLTYRNNQLIEQEINVSDVNDRLHEIQLEKIQYKWLSKSQIPFEMLESDQKQLNIFDEHSHLILLISIPQQNNSKRDLVFVYFKNEIDQFGIHHQKAKMSTQNKTIIGHLISNSAKSCSKMYWSQEEKLMRFTLKSQQIIKQQVKSDSELVKIDGLQKLIIGWAQSTLEEYCKSDGLNYVYSKEALEKIISFKGEFSDLKIAINDAIEYVKVLASYIQQNKQVLIEKEYITYVNTKSERLNTDVNYQIPPRLQKAHELLDKLEKHALLISQQGLNLTSFNVGQAMERSITPAAISDSISKNKTKINLLIKQFPERWGFIRNNFRPIINVISKENDQLRNWG